MMTQNAAGRVIAVLSRRAPACRRTHERRPAASAENADARRDELDDSRRSSSWSIRRSSPGRRCGLPCT